MIEQDFQLIEKHVEFSLPAYYRATLLNYPFEADSFAAECLLPNDPQLVIDLIDPELPSSQRTKRFFVGSDGGEELYFVDPSKEDSAVFVFDMETRRRRVLTKSWEEYLDHIRAQHAEIAADEEAMRLRKLNKKWWQFWI